jgi:redox-sensitive bicupin YhaK (pirin superfamily)
MIKHIPYDALGKADHGWLKARHHFSFARYYNPERMGFGTLRVINDDWVAPGAGFAPHPHHDMEIITFVRSGEVTHEDNLGNKGITEAGEVQVMSAGTGVTHSEFNTSKDPLTLYQIWITPNKKGVAPRWESKPFSSAANNKASPNTATSSLPLLVSGYEDDHKEEHNALFIHQHARIYGGALLENSTATHTITHQAYVLASKGDVELITDSATQRLTKGDGAEVTNTQAVTIKAYSDAEIILIDAPA